MTWHTLSPCVCTQRLLTHPRLHLSKVNPGRCHTQINLTFASALVTFAVDHAVDRTFRVLKGVLEVFLNFYNLSSKHIKKLHAVRIRYTCTHMRIQQTSTHMHLHAKTHTHACTHAHMHKHTHLHMHGRTPYTITYAQCTHACKHACTHVRTHTCMHVHMHARTYIHPRMHSHTHTRLKLHDITHVHSNTRMNTLLYALYYYTHMHLHPEDQASCSQL